MWHSQWDWQETDSRPLVHFKSRQGWNKQTGTVEIAPAAVSLPELPLLLTWGGISWCCWRKTALRRPP